MYSGWVIGTSQNLTLNCGLVKESTLFYKRWMFVKHHNSPRKGVLDTPVLVKVVLRHWKQATNGLNGPFLVAGRKFLINVERPGEEMTWEAEERPSSIREMPLGLDVSRNYRIHTRDRYKSAFLAGDMKESC